MLLPMAPYQGEHGCKTPMVRNMSNVDADPKDVLIPSGLNVY